MQVNEFQGSESKDYSPPRLVAFGSPQCFILGGPNPAGNDVANPELDGSTS